MNKQRKIRQEKGITLVALIITIIVLLILAVVTIRAVQGDGIIRYAQNAKTQYEEAQTNEQAKLQNYLDTLNANGGSSSEEEKVTWTQTSEGDLAIGSTVKTSTNEEFYVIGGDTAGTPITSSTQKVILLAKNNLKADGTAQDPTGAVNPCAFSSTNYWSSETNYPADLNDTEKYPIPVGQTSIVSIAKNYGANLGATGRLMTVEEIEALGGSSENSNTDDCPDFINSATYWLGSAYSTSRVWFVYGDYGRLSDAGFDYGPYYGVRPVVEVLKSNIS